MEKLVFDVDVVMERRTLASRWQTHAWSPAGVLPGTAASSGPRTVVEHNELMQRIYPGHTLETFRDEGEGYYLNVHSPEPAIFIAWRMSDDETEAIPHRLTLSYNEAARWMDGQEQVDRVTMPAEMLMALQDWVKANYQPPAKKQRIRPQSFESKDGRYKGKLS